MGDDQRVALPRDIVDGLYRGERRAHWRADEEHRLLLVNEQLGLDPLCLDAEVVWLSNLVVDGDI